MITGTVKFTVKVDEIEQFKEIGATMVAKARKDLGCISYQLYQDQNDQKVFMVIEEWETQEAFIGHTKSPDPDRIIPRINQTFEKDPEANFFTLLA